MKLTVGELLRNGRKQAQMSIEDVSKYLAEHGIKAATKTIYNWEIGNANPSLHAFFTLCARYGINDILGTLGYLDEDFKN